MAEDKQCKGIYEFGGPADCDIEFVYACCYCAVERVYCKGGKLQTECCLGASGSGNCIEENHCTGCQQVSAAHYDHRRDCRLDEVRNVRVYPYDSCREQAEQQGE